MRSIAALLLATIMLSGELCAAGTVSPKAIPLIDGAVVTIHGRLTARFQGYKRFLAITTTTPYRLMFDPAESAPTTVHEIPILLEGNNDKLSTLTGKTITATGKVQLEPVSPYYLNGIFLRANSVVLPDGTAITPKEYKAPTISVDRYMANITLIPGRERQYKSWDPVTLRSLASQDISGCGLNGGGDVVNCFCITGFHASRIGAAGTGEKLILKDVTAYWAETGLPADQAGDFGQVGIDESARKPVIVEVECTRETKK